MIFQISDIFTALVLLLPEKLFYSVHDFQLHSQTPLLSNIFRSLTHGCKPRLKSFFFLLLLLKYQEKTN